MANRQRTMDTGSPAQAFGAHEPKIELVTSAIADAPPISDLAVRTRQGVEVAWQPRARRHQIVAGAGWKTSSPHNRVTIPSDINLITVNGAPSEVVEFNTPFDSQSIVRALQVYVADRVQLTGGLSLDAGVLADFSRGSLPAQSKGDGQFAHPQTFPAQSDLIVWNSVSPRAGLAWQVPHLRRLVLRGAYFRLYLAAGREIPRLRKSQQPCRGYVPVDRPQFRRQVSVGRGGSPADALWRTLLVHSAFPAPAIRG